MDFMNSAISAVGKGELEAVLALLREPTTNAIPGTMATPADIQLATRALQAQTPVEEYIHRATQPTDAQQYLTLAVQASEIPPTALHAFDGFQTHEMQHQHDMNDDLALAQLLANNGSLFNGAVGGMDARNTDSSAKAAIAALTGRKGTKRRNTRIRGISTIGTELNADEHAFDERAIFNNDALFDESEEYLNEYADGNDEEDADDAEEFEIELEAGEFDVFAAEPQAEQLPAYGHYGIESSTADRKLMT